MHLRSLIQRHVKHTSSTVGRAILLDWDAQSKNFVKVGPSGAPLLVYLGEEAGVSGGSPPATRSALHGCHPPPRRPPAASAAPQVWPREFRRAMDEAAKLKAAQASEEALLKEAGGSDAFEELKQMALQGGWVQQGAAR